MKKLTRILMMMLVLTVGTGITSCDEIEAMIDNPVVPEPTPTPTPTPAPTPTPEEIENQRIAEAKALLEESRQEGALVNLTYTVNGVERVASFKRVGDKYVLQNPSATRADGAEGDEYVPYLMDYDTDEDPENDKELDDADLDKDIEEEFEYEDGDDGDDSGDDDTENLDNDAIADQLEWDDTTDDDDGDDAADGDVNGGATAGTRTLVNEGTLRSISCNMIAGARSTSTYADCTQALLMPRTATFTQSFAIVAERLRTRSQEPIMAFTGKIEVNGKTFTYKPSEAGTRANKKRTLDVPKSGTLRITKVVFKKRKNLIYKKGNIMQVQVLPTNAKVTKVTWKADKNLTLAKPRQKGNHHNIISTCKVTPQKRKKFKITCTAKGYGRYIKSYFVKTVYANAEKVEISYNKTKVESLTFTEGDQPKQLTATVTPSNANPDVIWTSSKEDVATVDDNGNVTPKGAGSAIITCTSDANSEVTATCTVTVNAAEKSISSVTINNSKLTDGKLTLVAGSSEAFTATVGPDGTTETDKTVKWSVTDDGNGGDVVTITTADDGTCTVTANHEGTATLTATAGKNNVSASVTITVTAQTNTVSPSGGYKNGGDPTNPGGGV